MADRRLVKMFMGASVLPDTDQLEAMLDTRKRHYLASNPPVETTFFNLPAYDNPIGIEIEGENYKGCDRDLWYWRTDDDMSLKMRGVELISTPLVRTHIDLALAEAEYVCKNLTFGHRTSVHIHCNVSHYTTNQLAVLGASYAMLEHLFYDLVAYERWGNSFCYPLVGTPAVFEWHDYDGEPEHGQRTTKYCAFNIAPVQDQMSVEFRHMHGNCDPKTLRRWIQICAKLVYYCGKLDTKTCVNDLITTISSKKFGEVIPNIWGDTAQIFDRRSVERSMRNGELWAITLLTGL